MGLFTTILSKLGIGEEEEAPADAKPTASSSSSRSPSRSVDRADKQRMAAARAARKPSEMSMVDVVSKLDGLAAANPEKLSWKVSIVDLLKLLDIESSYEARKELAVELSCPAELMDDSAKMNIWLHKTVLQKIAKNGGNIPKELLD